MTARDFRDQLVILPSAAAVVGPMPMPVLGRAIGRLFGVFQN